MNFFISFSDFIIDAADYLWNGPILVTLLLGGGIFFSFRSRLVPLLFFNRAITLLRKKGDSSKGISSYESVSSQIAGIVGMGNISGVAVAISIGGPGAIFWMWVTAFLGMITKFYTCSLSVMYRKKSENKFFGGPMYVIENGLGKQWKLLATVFCFFGLLGVSPIFQSNQIVEVFNSVILKNQFFFNNKFYSDLSLGLILAIIVSFVILGGISRIGKVASKIAPIMVLVYMITVFYLMIIHFDMIIPSFKLIFTDAFSANSVLGGSIASIILIGARRASFSNEAGIGTAPIIHASSQSENPIEEGLVSMIGPFVDTIIVCTLTALCILVTDSWTNFNYAGIELVAEAFNSSMPNFGPYILLFTTLTFAISTLFSLSFFGERCMAYLFGESNKIIYRYIYLCLIVIGSVSSLKFVISLIDLSYGIMAFPTIISALFLAPKVDKMSKKYFKNLKHDK
tara:strand:+ start:1014 stop:2378 length:1365 start_codon:yes stop_codon:yes gene_type:complete